jgi:hypothetical protein
MLNKANHTEIEIRGVLSDKSCVRKLVTKIKKQSKVVIQESKQMVVFYKENNQDFRIKWDKDKNYFEFVYKTKQGIQRTVRDEFTINIDKKQIGDFFKILEELGLKKGFISPTHRIDVITSSIIWSFKLGSVIGDYWEAEATNQLTQELKGDTNKIKVHLENKARSLGLFFWSENEFRKLRQEKWSDVQPVKNSKIMRILQNDRY